MNHSNSLMASPVTQSVIAHNAAYQADELDAYDSDCDEISTAKAVLMANLSSYELDVLSEVPISDNTNNDMLNQSVHEMPYFEPSHFVEHPENEIHSDSNIIPYSHYLIESQNAVVQDTNSSAQQDALILSEKEARNIDKEIALEKKVKELSNIVCKMGQSTQTVLMITKPQVFYDNNLKQALGFQNPLYLKKAQQIRPMLYDGSVIAKETNVISVADYEETLMLEEESRSKMLLKQNFSKHFVPQQELSDDKAFRLQPSHPNTHQSASSPVKINAPRELPKNNTSVNQTEPSYDQLFELNNSKDELQAKDTTIKKLKSQIKRVNETSTSESVKKDLDEIETINIELEHRVTRLIAENEHLKHTYKQLYDSIKPSRIRAKEHTDSLVNQLNQKSIEVTDLNAQLQEKVFVITSLKNDLRKLKGKEIVDNVAHVSNTTTNAPGMYKLDPVILAPKVKNNREAHKYYLKHTWRQAKFLGMALNNANHETL
ncbi:hypothetical protein Tco_0012804 [Tanacetum coccineum]